MSIGIRYSSQGSQKVHRARWEARGVGGAKLGENVVSANILSEFDDLASANNFARDAMAAEPEDRGLSMDCEQYPLACKEPAHPTSGTARICPANRGLM